MDPAFQGIRRWLESRAITEVEAIVPDLSGVARGKVIPAGKYQDEAGMRLPEAIFIQTITGEYPDGVTAFRTIDGDMLTVPDPATIRMVPWAAEPTAQIIHDCYYFDGSAVEMAPRYVLKRVVKLYEDQGWMPVVAPELEFYLVKPNKDADYPLEPPIGRSGRPEMGRQSYSIDAVNEFDDLFEDVYDYCEAQGLEIDTLIHEAGAAQMEINLNHGNPIELADQALLFKRTVRETALRHRTYATFMAKPMENQPGSALHLHQSVVDREHGRNVFSRRDGEPSRLFLHHIGGLQKYLPAAMLMLAPNVNSYRRLTRYQSAPINLQWGHDNRTAGLRMPNSDPDARRVENRVSGADANPYLAIAASLACGYLGMMEQIKPTEALASSAYDKSYGLPRNIEESLTLLRACEPLREILGESFVEAYTAVKETEYEAFLHVISSWEREYLLLNV